MAKPTIPQDPETGALTGLRHHNPHAILGAHPGDGGGVVVRVFRPDATTVRLIRDGVAPVQFAHGSADGLFEATVPGTRDGFRYRLEIGFPDGGTILIGDPYSF